MTLFHKYLLIIVMSIIVFRCFSQTSSSPTDITGLFLWLKADAGIQLNGTNVVKWSDQAIYNIDFSQNTLSYQPQWISSSSMNGKPYIHFDGMDDILFSDSLISLNDVSIFIVASQYSNDFYGRFIDHDSNNGFWVGRNATSNEIGGGFKELNPPYGNYTNKNDGEVFLLSMTRTNDSTYLYNNNNSFPLPYRVTFPGATSLNKISLGGTISYGLFGKKNIFEIIIFNKKLSLAEIDYIEYYIADKYSPKINLGNDINIPANNGCIPSNSVTLTANPNFQSFLWNNGNTSNQISVNQYGEYSVICTDIFGIQHYDTIKVLPTPINFNYPSYPVLCSNNNQLVWNTFINKSNNTLLWQDNSNDSLITINSPGKYYIKVTDNYGCNYISDTLRVIQDNFPTTGVSLGPDISLCAGNQITLTSGIQPGLTYTWSTGQTSAAITVTNTGEYSVIVTNTNNCVAKDTIDVTITGFVPEPLFSNNIACKNQTVNFTNLSLAPPGNTISSYLWDFGDPLSTSNTSTLSNPSHTYADTGFYQVSLQIQTDVGCGKGIAKTIHVASTPTVNYTSSISCQNDSTSFSGSAITAPYSVSSYKWDFGDPVSGSANSSSKLNPKHLFSDVAFFPVKFLVTNSAGCKDSIIKNINVRSQVKADFTYQPPCSKTNVVFQDNSIVPNPSASHPRIWVLALQTNTFTFSGLSFSNTFTTTGVYPLSLTVNGTNGCTSTISRLIQIYQKPSVDFEIPSICLNDTIQILNHSLPGSGVFNQFSWSLNSNTISSVPSPSLSFATPGIYSLALTVSNTAQCKDSISKTFTVNPLPNVTFTSIPPTYIYKDSSVTFVPSVINGSTYNWTIGGQNYNTPSPSIYIDSVGTYSVNLFLIDENGCKNSGSGTFKAYDSYLDLEVKSIISNVTSNNYLNVQVDVTNKGTIPIANFEIKKTVSDASQVKETFNGIINPGVSYRYQFNSEDNISNDLKNRLICVELESINRRMDQDMNNNQMCDALNINEIQVFEPQPNPANQIDVLLPVIVPYSQEVKVDIINSIGELVSPQYSVQLNEGLNYIKIPSSGLSHGTYLIKVVIEDKVFVKKLLKY